jgi:hypothetical protein
VDADGHQTPVRTIVAADHDQRGGTGLGVEGTGLFFIEEIGPDLLFNPLVGYIGGGDGGGGDRLAGLGRIGHVLLAEAHRVRQTAVA